MRFQSAVVLILVGQTLDPVSGAAPAPARPPGERPQTRIARLYRKNCGDCHGADGTGNGPVAHALVPRPRDFVEGGFKIRSTGPGDVPTDADLERAVRRGMPGTPMPAFQGRLTDAEIHELVDVLKGFSPRFDVDGPGMPVDIPAVPRRTSAIIEDGKRAFRTMGCVTCHGPGGRGDGPRAGELVDVEGLPARPRDLTRRALYKGGTAPADLYRTLATGLDGSPMGALKSGVPDAARWQLAWYLHSLAR